MNYYRLFTSNIKIMLFAILLTLYSGFGQTFVLSLYIPAIIEDFAISSTLFSSIYAAATICSGFTMIFAGKLIDRVSLIRFALVVVLGIITANLVAGLTLNLFMLFLAFFLLRFFGQGLLSHTSMTSMGRYFSYARGKALSIAYLGFPLAEAILPVTIITLILVVGWRETFFLSAIFILLTLLPLVWYLIKDFDKSKVVESAEITRRKVATDNQPDKEWTQKEIIRNRYFYIFAPTAFINGFSLTALFFFQVFIAEFKGWSAGWMAFSISAYAVSSFFFSIFAGPLVDRFTSRKVFPFVLLPMALGLLVLIFFDHPSAALLFWFLAGITAGANPTTSNALYAETYGVKNLGSIRSIFTFVMIISTAAGPVVYSFLTDQGFTYNHIHLLLTGIIFLNFLYILWGLSWQKARM